MSVIGHNSRQHFYEKPNAEESAPIALSVADQARLHEERRLTAVCEVMCLVAILRYCGILTNPVPVTLGATVLQYNYGNKLDGTNAAHVLPGQLLFAGEEPNDILNKAGEGAVRRSGVRALQISMKIRNLFGQTDIVDVAVNNADSSVEGKRGWKRLKDAFPASMEDLMRQMEHAAPKSWPEVLKAVTEGFRTYHNSAGLIYADAKRRALEKIKAIPGRKSYYQQRVDIIDIFTRVLQQQRSPDALRGTAFSSLLRDVVDSAPPG